MLIPPGIANRASKAQHEALAPNTWTETRTVLLGDGSGNIIDSTAQYPSSLFWHTNSSQGHEVGSAVRAPECDIQYEENPSYAANPPQVIVGYPPGSKILSMKGTAPTYAGYKARGNMSQIQQSINNVQENVPASDIVVTADPVQPSLNVILGKWEPIVNGVKYTFPQTPQSLTDEVPAPGEMCYSAVAVSDDYLTVEVSTSTSRPTTGLPLNDADIQECLDGFTPTSTPVRAFKLIGNQLAITQSDINNDSVDLRQRINTINGVSIQFSIISTATVANTTIETTLLGTAVGSKTLRANSLHIGKSLRLIAYGIVSDTGTPTLRFKLKLGSTIIVDTAAVTLASGITNKLWKLEILLTCRTVGVTGTVFAQAQFQYNNGTPVDVPATATITIDTTVSQLVDLTATWGTASASNTVSCTNCTAEVLS